jgi:zinc/manganese transport system ATP-binding protein
MTVDVSRRIDDAAPETGRSPAAVRLTDAAVRVGGRTIWSGVDLTVEHGQFVAILGPNGVGKSTMIMALLGLLPLSAGTAEVLGEHPGAARQRIGYLPQRRSFDPGLRVRGIDVVRLGLDGDRWGLPLPGLGRRRGQRIAAARRIDEVVDLVGAMDYAHRPIGQISGGEQQRLLIAQALARQPQMLFLDEPLDSLDLPNQSAVAALVARICRDERVTVLLVAHDVNPVLGYLDRVIYLGRGAAAIGTPAEVITTDTLSRLYGTAIEVLSTSDGRLVVVGQPEPPSHHTDRHAH